MEIFYIASQQVAGPKFGACNLIVEEDVASAFSEIGSGDSALHSYRMTGYPFILTYRSGYPVGHYNGDRSVASLVDFAQTLACSAGYYEPVGLSAGVQVESPLVMPPYDPYGRGKKNPARTSSVQFRSDQPIRGYDPNLGGPVYEGSPEARAATKRLEEAEAQRASRGGSLFPTYDVGSTAAEVERPVIAEPRGPSSAAEAERRV